MTPTTPIPHQHYCEVTELGDVLFSLGQWISGLTQSHDALMRAAEPNTRSLENQGFLFLLSWVSHATLELIHESRARILQAWCPRLNYHYGGPKGTPMPGRAHHVSAQNLGRFLKVANEPERFDDHSDWLREKQAGDFIYAWIELIEHIRGQEEIEFVNLEPTYKFFEAALHAITTMPRLPVKLDLASIDYDRFRDFLARPLPELCLCDVGAHTGIWSSNHGILRFPSNAKEKNDLWRPIASPEDILNKIGSRATLRQLVLSIFSTDASASSRERFLLADGALVGNFQGQELRLNMTGYPYETTFFAAEAGSPGNSYSYGQVTYQSLADFPWWRKDSYTGHDIGIYNAHFLLLPQWEQYGIYNTDALYIDPMVHNCMFVFFLKLPLLFPKVIYVPINPIIAPPRRLIPSQHSWTRWRADNTLLHGEFNAEINSDLIFCHCSLQSTIDAVAKAGKNMFDFLHIDGYHAVFVQKAFRDLFPPMTPMEAWYRGWRCRADGFFKNNLEIDSGLDGFDLTLGANTAALCRAHNISNVSTKTLNSFPDHFKFEESETCVSDRPEDHAVVEEKFEKYFGYLARCEENFCI